MGRVEQQAGSASEQILHVNTVGLGAASEHFVKIATAHGYAVVASGPNRFRLARTYRPKFLLVKRVETGDAVIAEERAGIRVRLTGELLPSFVEALNQALVAPVAAVRVSPPPAAVPVSSPVPPVTLAAHVAPAPPVPRAAPAAPESMLVFADGRSIAVGVGGVLGRDPSADPTVPNAPVYPIADPSLSKTHLSFGPLPNGVWVLDHHSTNGTVVSAGGVTTPCTPGVRVEVPFGARVVAGDLGFMIGSR